MTSRIVPIKVKKGSPVFGDTNAGDVWFDPYKGVKVLICCPNCGARLYAITKKEWTNQKNIKADDCCGATLTASSQGFFINNVT